MICIGGTTSVSLILTITLNGFIEELVEVDKGNLVISPALLDATLNNPFDSPGDSPMSSYPSSDEELYSHAADLPIPITPEPVTRKGVDVSGPVK